MEGIVIASHRQVIDNAHQQSQAEDAGGRQQGFDTFHNSIHHHAQYAKPSPHPVPAMVRYTGKYSSQASFKCLLAAATTIQLRISELPALSSFRGMERSWSSEPARIAVSNWRSSRSLVTKWLRPPEATTPTRRSAGLVTIA